MSNSTRAKAKKSSQDSVAPATAADAGQPNKGDLRAHEDSLRATLDNLLEGCQIIDRDWRYVYVNPTVASQGRSTPAALIGRTMMEAYPGIENGALFPMLERCMFDRIPATLSNEFIFADGSIGVFELRIQPVPEGIFILSVDVTEKKRVEDALAIERQRLEKIADAVPGLICTILQHTDGRVTIPYASKAIEAIYGFTAAQVADNFALITQRVSDEDNIRLMASMVQASATMQSWHSEYQYHHPTRGWIWLEGHATPVHDTDGAIRWHGVIMDITARKTADTTLRESENRFRSLFENSPIAYQSLDGDGRYIDVNPELCRLLGYRADELLGKEFVELWTPGTTAAFPEHYSRFIREGAIEAELRLVCKDGRVITVLLVGGIQHDASGHFLRTHCILHDITARKAAEQAVYASEEKYRGLVESLDSVVAVVHASGRFLFVNEFGARQLGGGQNAVMGKMMTDIFPEPFASSQLKNVRRVIETDEPLVVENQSFIRGEPHWYRTSIQPLHDDDGTVTRAILNSTDITHQKAIQRELEELNQTLEQRVHERTAQLQDLYDNAPVGYHSLDAQGRFMMINQTELNWLGYTHEEVVGKMTIADFLAPHCQDVFERTFAIFKSQGRIKDVEIDFVRKDGSILPISITAAAVVGPHGEFLMSRSTISDITERKKAGAELRARQEELSAANLALAKAAKLKDEFMANMSHELRTPLTGILGLSEALQMEVYGQLNAKQAKSIHSIEESGRHLLNLINDILDLSKIEAGKLELELSDVNIDDLCQASLRMIKQMAAGKQQSVTYSLHPAGLTVRADQRRLKQAIVNLLSNAVKFTPENGELGLFVEADRTHRVIYFTVWDKGIGIAPEATERLFKPFVQLDSSLARGEGGTGLGLSLVQRLAELHGGSVSLESTPGQGSRFTVAIPWLETPTIAPEKPTLTADIRATIASVLVLDDSPTAVNLVSGYLRELGIKKIITQTRADGAMERIRATRPAAIILDILLPDGSGWDILRQLKTDPTTATIPVIVISVIDERPKALQMGAVEHILKPVSRSDLQVALKVAQRVIGPERQEPVMVVSNDPERETILLAEDHEISRLLVCDYLTAQGYAMLTAQTGNEALQIVQDHQPALILMDIQMPEMDGLEAIRAVRGLNDQALAQTPIVALTALSMPGDRERCLAAGADVYLSKPVDFNGLAVSIRTLLDRQNLANT